MKILKVEIEPKKHRAAFENVNRNVVWIEA